MTLCAFKYKQNNQDRTADLSAHWEVAEDVITDNYTPDEISAKDLLTIWSQQVEQTYPNGLISISWYVVGSGFKTEFFPFAFDPQNDERRKDFLHHYTWPIDARTRKEINWLELPVRDKLWNTEKSDKGGFIQEATSWKPSILQPYVYLPSLTKNLT
ncbi:MULTISPECIES: hypothetical protein [Spirulina sp. CCY15215]|uniref:hypothetical protein n=1 Tax=Spirulina sp. CCY15215 TaxID=2767591 RepID=UPI001950D56E|nr:hypothetical protein [Spirulina major]